MNSKKKQTPEQFYGYRGQSHLYSDPEDVVNYYMEDEDYADFPIKVYVFRHIDITADAERYSKCILDEMVERLDEEYGDPDGYSEPTENMHNAALAFAKAIIDEYQIWACEPTGEVIEYTKEEAENIAGVSTLERSENIKKKKLGRLNTVKETNDYFRCGKCQ